VPVAVLGRGSNLVVSSRGFAGLVVRPSGSFASWAIGEDGTVAAGAAVPLPLLARRTAEAGRGGLEFYAGIPGSVGGAVCMNAGCHGSDTAEWLIVARVADVATGVIGERTPADLEMSYRHSAIGPREVVLGAVFRTVVRPRAEAEGRIREVTRWRREHQPGGTLNAGSVFKNPPGDSAGRIIDSLGLKGHRIGGAAVSERHANFFEADRDASPEDVRRLVTEVRARVRDATGIVLEPEIRFLGEFDDEEVS
jgi:UDP-N-acetylmuramate dehydrogenase